MEIRVAAWGWKHQAWEQGVFYPDDLPADWRLSYYGNEFDAVVIPAPYWLEGQEDEEDWAADVADEFHFIIDWPTATQVGAENLDTCTQACNAFIAQLEPAQCTLLINNESWAGFSDDQQSNLLQLTEKYSVLQYGEAEPVAAIRCADEDGVILISSELSETLRELSSRLQKQVGEQTHTIILNGTPPAIERLKELKTLVTLLRG